MKKRLFSLLLILALLLPLCAAIHADELQFVYAESEQILEDLGARIYDDTGTAVCIYIAEKTAEWEEIRSFAESFYNERIACENGILLVHYFSEGTGRISYYKVGEKLASLSDEDMGEIMQAYNSADTFSASFLSNISVSPSRTLAMTSSTVIARARSNSTGFCCMESTKVSFFPR